MKTNIFVFLVSRYHKNNQTKAAKVLGMSRACLNNYVRGKRVIKSPLLKRIRAVYGVAGKLKSKGLTDTEILDLIS